MVVARLPAVGAAEDPFPGSTAPRCASAYGKAQSATRAIRVPGPDLGAAGADLSPAAVHVRS